MNQGDRGLAIMVGCAVVMMVVALILFTFGIIMGWSTVTMP